MRGQALVVQGNVAGEVDFRILGLRDVARQRCLCLVQRDRERPRIDARQHVPLLYLLAFLEQHRRERTVDLRFDGDGDERRCVTQAVQEHGHVAQRRGRSDDGDGPRFRRRAAGRRSLSTSGLLGADE